MSKAALRDASEEPEAQRMSLSEQLRHQAIPKFRNAYIRLADLEQVSREDAGDGTDSGRKGSARSAIKHVLLAAQNRSPDAGRKNESHDSRAGNPQSASYFCRMLEQELARVRRFGESFAEELWVRLGAVSEAVDKVRCLTDGKDSAGVPVDRVNAMATECDLIGDDLILLDEFLRQNVIASAFIAQWHDSRQVTNHVPCPSSLPQISPAYLQAMENYLMGGLAFDAVLVWLSDAYCELRRLTDKAYGDDAVWNAPDKFQRNTTKFWVHPADVLRLKCDVIKHLPILIYGKGKDRGGAKSRLSSLQEQAVRDGTLISSVYFDNNNMDTYHERLRREHGSSLVRIRWYGKRTVDPEDESFVERKIHKDGWTGERSVKERAPITSREVAKFVHGDYIPQLQSNGCHGELLEDIQRRIVTRKEEPLMRTEYTRVAFQESTSNEVRISLDSHVRMIREKGAPRGAAGGWCRDLRSKPSPRDVVHFPYAIFELKVCSEEPPEWVQDLLDSGMLVEVPKFSKFLHGSALLFGDSVKNCPFWFVPDGKNRWTPATLAEMSDPYDQYKKDSSSYLFPESGTKGRQPSKRRNTVATPTPQQMQVSTLCNVPNATVLSEVVVLPSSKTNGKTHQVIQTSVQNRSGCSLQRSQSAQLSKLEVRVGHEETQDASEKNQSTCKSRTKKTWGGWLGKGGGGEPPSPHGAGAADDASYARSKALVRTRIEPKTFFANERTFLSWLTIAVMVMFLGLSLLDGSNLGSGSLRHGASPPGHACGESRSCRAAQICGALISPIAVVLMLYALYMYRKRSIQILRRETVRFDDQCGPVVITVLLVSVLITAFVISLKYNLT